MQDPNTPSVPHWAQPTSQAQEEAEYTAAARYDLDGLRGEIIPHEWDADELAELDARQWNDERDTPTN